MNEKHHIQCDCGTVKVEMTGDPKVHAFCHCEDCRQLLQVPYHSVLAFDPENVRIIKGEDSVTTFQHPTLAMKRIFCGACGDVLYNTNGMGWKLVSQLMYRKCNDDTLPQSFTSNAHFFYDRRIVDIDDTLRKA